MTFDLHVDAARWRAQGARTVAERPGLVPVVKGNGYGFGRERLAAETARLGVDVLAVGSYAELPSVREAFPGDLLVLSPWRPAETAHLADPRLIHTVSRASDLAALELHAAASPRVVLEVLTSMRRHGMALEEVAEAVERHPGVRLEGVALHLPMVGDVLGEAHHAVGTLRERGLQAPVWVSHLRPHQATELTASTGLEVRTRTGTDLWLGERAALAPKAEVLDVHELSRGDRYGYRQRRAPGPGALVVVAGGTAHGVALEAPKSAAGAVSRAKVLALGGLEAAGKVLSPYRWQGRARWFAEPPHMQVSMLWLPRSVPPPAVGDRLDVEVRFTTTLFDRVLGLD